MIIFKIAHGAWSVTIVTADAKRVNAPVCNSTRQLIVVLVNFSNK